MSHANSRGDFVFGQDGQPWVRWINNGVEEYIHPLRATQLHWLHTSAVAGNFQISAGEHWRPAKFDFVDKKLKVLAEKEIRTIRAGGGVIAWDDGHEVETSWGLKLPGMALCEVDDLGVVYVTTLEGRGLSWYRLQGSSGVIVQPDAGIVSRASEDTRARGGVVSWQDAAGLRIHPKLQPYVERTEKPIVAIPLRLGVSVERTLTRITVRRTESRMGIVIATGPELHALDAVGLSNDSIVSAHFLLPGQLRGSVAAGGSGLVFRNHLFSLGPLVDLNSGSGTGTGGGDVDQAILARLETIKQEQAAQRAEFRDFKNDITTRLARIESVANRVDAKAVVPSRRPSHPHPQESDR